MIDLISKRDTTSVSTIPRSWQRTKACSTHVKVSLQEMTESLIDEVVTILEGDEATPEITAALVTWLEEQFPDAQGKVCILETAGLLLFVLFRVLIEVVQKVPS